MARYAYLIYITLLLSACAEVGTISGGPEDEFAPRPIDARCEPKNGSVNFQGQQVELVFDEFFRLNDPSNNIRMVPPHAEVRSQMKGKSLILSWDTQLENNVTYALYLNNAVSDITENNDSIIQYVFSTGPSLDSLFYEVAVADAWSGDPVKGCTVGLYDPEKDEIQSFAETDKKGLARLQFLRPGNYRLLAFMDENKDLALQADEAVAFPDASQVAVASGFVFDSIPLRMSRPKNAPKLRTIRPEYPGVLTLAAEEGLADAKVYVRGVKQDAKELRWLGADSLLIPIDLGQDDFIEVIVQSSSITDTLRVRGSKTDQAKRVAVRPVQSSGAFSPRDSVALWCNDWIVGLDSTKFLLRDGKDSSLLRYSVSFEYNELLFHFPDRSELEKVLVNLEAGAIRGTHGESTQTVFQLSFQQARKYGALLLDLTAYEHELVLHIQKGGKIVRSILVSDPSVPLRIEYLDPGDYTFAVIRDENNNGRWDVGDYTKGVQPELVDRYSEIIKVRANWDVETALTPLSTP